MKRRPVVALFGALALLLSAAVGTATAKLPTPNSTLIAPNVSLGGVKLGSRYVKQPKGWGTPTKCLRNVACVWTERSDALPPEGQKGITGPYIFVAAQKGKVTFFIIGVGDKSPDAGPLRKWHMAKGVGFGDSVQTLLRAYPTAVKGRLPGQYVLWGAGRTRRTNFRFANGKLAKVELFSCSTGNCTVT